MTSEFKTQIKNLIQRISPFLVLHYIDSNEIQVNFKKKFILSIKESDDTFIIEDYNFNITLSTIDTIEDDLEQVIRNLNYVNKESENTMKRNTVHENNSNLVKVDFDEFDKIMSNSCDYSNTGDEELDDEGYMCELTPEMRPICKDDLDEFNLDFEEDFEEDSPIDLVNFEEVSSPETKLEPEEDVTLNEKEDEPVAEAIEVVEAKKVFNSKDELKKYWISGLKSGTINEEAALRGFESWFTEGIEIGSLKLVESCKKSANIITESLLVDNVVEDIERSLKSILDAHGIAPAKRLYTIGMILNNMLHASTTEVEAPDYLSNMIFDLTGDNELSDLIRKVVEDTLSGKAEPLAPETVSTTVITDQGAETIENTKEV